MSSSESRRGAVLGPDALAAFGVATPAAWRPREIAGADAPAAPADALPVDDVFTAFAAFAPEALDAAPSVLGAWATDAGFADALPDFLMEPDDATANAALAPELSLARERALRDDLVREFEAQLGEMQARHEQELAEAYAAGMSEGQREGAAAAERRVATVVGALDEARRQLGALQDRWLANLDENVAVLAVGVARHVIGREVAADDTLVRARVANAMAEFPLDQPLNLRINPADLATLKAAFDVERAIGTRELRWTADERIARGGCLIEGRERIVDGRVDTALERVYRRLSGQHA
jgi:flagellar biosynthesis/type III secretory pathway protein FliH